MGDSVFLNNRAAVHMKSMGKSIAFPDVCLCPPTPPTGPVPVPLPNTVMPIDLMGGALTVMVEGGPAGGAQSFFAKSTGNEVALPTGGGVMTFATMGMAHWGSFSMNVMIEGQPGVRHMDLLTHNHLAPQPGNTPPSPWISMLAPPMVPPRSLVKQEKENDWLELMYVNEKGKAIRDIGYSVQLPDGRKVEDNLLGGGHLTLLGIPKGSCVAKLVPDAKKK